LEVLQDEAVKLIFLTITKTFSTSLCGTRFWREAQDLKKNKLKKLKKNLKQNQCYSKPLKKTIGNNTTTKNDLNSQKAGEKIACSTALYATAVFTSFTCSN